MHDTLSQWLGKPLSTLPLGIVQTSERRQRLTYLRRRLVATIHSSAPKVAIWAFSSKDPFSHLPFPDPVPIASVRSSASPFNDSVSRGRAGRTLMWIMNIEPLIGNFDPWAVLFAFRLEHRPCLVRQRTRRLSCLARRVLVRRSN